MRDARYKLTGPGSEGDPQLGQMSKQQLFNPLAQPPVNPIVPPPPGTNGTGGGNPTFDPNQDIKAQQVFDPNTPTSLLGTNPNVPTPPQIDQLT